MNHLSENKQYFIGVDLGTSSVKLLLMDECGNILKIVSKEYPLSMPSPGWSEQNPEDWWTQTILGIKELLASSASVSGFQNCLVKGISFGGQMHGLVILDKNDNVIRPAILWNDGRTIQETEYLNNVIGTEKLKAWTGNIAFAGFTAPKILWLKKHEPENFEKINKIMLPKDFLAYKLSGVHASDYSDSSGMLLLDVKNKCWSEEMLEICSVRKEWMPKLFESFDTIGTILPEVALELGLSEDCLIAAGAGDNAAAAVGTGTVGNGAVNISLGTSGTLFVSEQNFSIDNNNSIHSFAHADGSYHLMGCMLSAASCVKWWMKEILTGNDFDGEARGIDSHKLGKNQIYFLPYLMGERSPHNDPLARGAFIGMTPAATKADMLQAIYEGVAFGLKESLEAVGNITGSLPQRTTICGGGAKSELWRHIVANVLNMEVDTVEVEEGPAYGAAILASVAAGVFSSVEDAVQKIVRRKDTILPDKEIAALYEKRYDTFKKMYPALKDVFPVL